MLSAVASTEDAGLGGGAPVVVRALDPSEAYFYLMDRVSCINFVTVVERESPWPADLLRRALDAMSECEPVLQVGVAMFGEPAEPHFVRVPTASIPFEEVDLDSGDWVRWVEEDLRRPFTQGLAPLMRCVQLRSTSDGRACLMLTMHHCISDGRGAAELVKRLVDHMMLGGALEPGDAEGCDGALPSGMHAMFPQRFRWKDDPGSLRRMSSALLRDAAAGGMLTDLPWFRSEPGAKRPRLVRVWLSEAQTGMLVLEAKRRGVSMHGLLCAAQLIAEATVLARHDASKLLLTCPVDMRHQVESAIAVSPMQLYASMIFATYAVDMSRPLWELAGEVMARTRSQLERGDAHYFYSSREVAKALAPGALTEAFSDALDVVPPGSVMSAVGKIPTIESDPEVTSVSFAICSGKRHVIFSAASSYRGRMVINVAFDEANLAAGIGEALASEMKAALVSACECCEGALA